MQTEYPREMANQLERTLASGCSIDKKIHASRVAIKKLRALWRFAVPSISLEIFKKENEALKAASQQLSTYRDHHIQSGILEKYMEHCNPDAEIPLTVNFCEQNYQYIIESDLQDSMDVFRISVETLINSGVINDELLGNFKSTYRKARQRYKAAMAEPSPEHRHKFRKRTKDLLYQLNLLDEKNKSEINSYSKHLKYLCDDLGREHDLDIFESWIETDPLPFGGEDIKRWITRRRKKLHRKSVYASDRLFKQTPNRWQHRFFRKIDSMTNS